MKHVLMYYLSLIIPKKLMIKELNENPLGRDPIILTIGYFMWLIAVWSLIIYFIIYNRNSIFLN